MNILSWILFGIITGIIAHMLDQDSTQSNIIVAIILGVSGALLGGVLANLMLGNPVSGFNLTSFLVAVVGSLGVLFLGRTFRKA